MAAFAETENAIRHGVNEHQAYILIRKLRFECIEGRRFLVPDEKYRRALWNLKECDHEVIGTEENQETSASLENGEDAEIGEVSENGEESEPNEVLEEHYDPALGYHLTEEETDFDEESEGEATYSPDEEANLF